MAFLSHEAVALVTGAGSGIGQAIATNLARRGCRKLFLVDIQPEGMTRTTEIIEAETESCSVMSHVADIANVTCVKDFVRSCVDTFGRIDYAINNAGLALGGRKTAEMDVEMFDKMCDVNEKGTFLCLKYEIEQMLKQNTLPLFTVGDHEVRNTRGVIVNIASITGLIALRDFSGYTSSKHAVCLMTKQLAREYAPHKIRINSVCPGIVSTPGVKTAGLTPEFEMTLSKQAPMNRWTLAEEVAEAVAFLCSSGASAITGVNLPVDCGTTTYHLI